MKDDFRNDRGRPGFWESLGLATEAAIAAAMCFPDGWHGLIYGFSGYKSVTWKDMGPLYDAMRKTVNSGQGGIYDKEELARGYLRSEARKYRTYAWHPAFWYAQGYDFDEMASRAVAANARDNLTREANAPQDQPDHMPELLMALMASKPRQLPPPAPYNVIDADASYDDQLPPEQDVSKHEPFDPDRFRRIDR